MKKLYSIDWNDVQNFYDSGNTWRKIGDKFDISDGLITYAKNKGLFKTRSKSEANKNYYKNNTKILTKEHKQKISESRIKYLKEHPDKVPYLLNHYTNGASYPEKYFDDILSKQIKYDKYYQVGIYQLDIAIVNKKIGIEIDGDQHYLDKKIIESDKRKNKHLKEQNWDLIRIKWSDYKKLTKEEKEKYINDLVNYINGLINIKPEFEIKNNKCVDCGKIISKCAKRCIKCNNQNRKQIKINFCINCGKPISKYATHCFNCYKNVEKNIKRQRKVKNRPNKEQLLLDIKEFGYCGTGRKYGVCDNTIRKWLK